MTKNDFDFETWFDNMALTVLDKCGVEPRDMDAFRDDYEAGRNCADVADEVAAEYADD